MNAKLILIVLVSLLFTVVKCEDKDKDDIPAEEICGKGQGDSKPDTPQEKKEETEAEENKDDKKEKKFFVSGDMRVTEKQKEEIDRLRQTGQKREATRRQNAKWPNGTVYYEIDGRLGSKAVEAIKGAIRDIEEYTCITFVKRVDKSIETFVKFIKQNGCWSYVGMLTKAILKQGYKQELSLGEGCEYKGTAIHEIFHALGFEHEHSRPDRDKYIKINFDNVESSQRYNFDKITNSISLGVGYDYNSIMHYPDWAFSKNGKPTIEPVGNAVGVEIGQRDGMTAGDIEQVNKFYECDKQSGSGNGGSFTQILKRGMKLKRDGGDNKDNGGTGDNGGGSSKDENKEGTGNGENENKEGNGENENKEGKGEGENKGENGNKGDSGDNATGGDKKPQDKKGGKCEAHYEKEQANKARKMAKKEELMRQQYENIKRREEEERLSAMLKKKKKR